MKKKWICALAAGIMLAVAMMPTGLAAERSGLLQDGDTDGSVYALQNYLYQHGYLNVAPTGFYGPLTVKAVAKYQAKKGLNDDGIAGPATLKAIWGDDYEVTTYSGDVSKDKFELGDRSLRVGDIQRRLMELGYMELTETTGYYGEVTAAAVKLFQRANKLKQDGIAGPATLTLMFSDKCRLYTIYPGDYGNDVKRLQNRLKDLKYFSGAVTTYYGPKTESAVKAFQKKNGLSADGVAGPKTLDKLYSASAKAASSGTSTKTTTSKGVDAAIKLAKSKLGCKYVWSTEGPDTFDCSGLVYYVMKNSGCTVSRLSSAGLANYSAWKKISSWDDLKKGDVLFFHSNSSSKVSHTAIYLGDNKIIHAESAKTGVVITTMGSGFKKNFVCARRPDYKN